MSLKTHYAHLPYMYVTIWQILYILCILSKMKILNNLQPSNIHKNGNERQKNVKWLQYTTILVLVLRLFFFCKNNLCSMNILCLWEQYYVFAILSHLNGFFLCTQRDEIFISIQGNNALFSFWDLMRCVLGFIFSLLFSLACEFSGC